MEKKKNSVQIIPYYIYTILGGKNLIFKILNPVYVCHRIGSDFTSTSYKVSEVFQESFRNVSQERGRG